MVPVPVGTKGRDLSVVIGKQHIRVGLKGKDSAILEGNLSEGIKPDDSLWNLGGWVDMCVSGWGQCTAAVH